MEGSRAQLADYLRGSVSLKASGTLELARRHRKSPAAAPTSAAKASVTITTEKAEGITGITASARVPEKAVIPQSEADSEGARTAGRITY